MYHTIVTLSLLAKPSTVTGVEVGLNTISWTAPSMLVDLEFYELHAIGRSASSENRTFRVLETFTSINTTSFKAVSITVQNRCGQRSEAVMIILPCEFTCMNACIILYAMLVCMHGWHYDLEKSIDHAWTTTIFNYYILVLTRTLFTGLDCVDSAQFPVANDQCSTAITPTTGTWHKCSLLDMCPDKFIIYSHNLYVFSAKAIIIFVPCTWWL